jgi:hypothetical protein
MRKDRAPASLLVGFATAGRGYEVVSTWSISPSDLINKERLLLEIMAEPAARPPVGLFRAARRQLLTVVPAALLAISHMTTILPLERTQSPPKKVR